MFSLKLFWKLTSKELYGRADNWSQIHKHIQSKELDFEKCLFIYNYKNNIYVYLFIYFKTMNSQCLNQKIYFLVSSNIMVTLQKFSGNSVPYAPMISSYMLLIMEQYV